MIVSAYEYFSPVGDILLGILIPFCIRRDLLKHVEIGDRRVGDL